MDPYFLRLQEANQLLTEYTADSTTRELVNTTFRYKNKNIFLYIQLLTGFSPTYLTFYNTAFAKSSDTLGHRVSPYQLLPGQIEEFIYKCERSTDIRDRLRIVVTDQSPEKTQMTPEQYHQQLQRQYEEEQQQGMGLALPGAGGKPKTGPEPDNTTEQLSQLKTDNEIKSLRGKLDILVNAYLTSGNLADLGEEQLTGFDIPSVYLEALIAEGLLVKPTDPEKLKEWEEKFQKLAEQLHGNQYKLNPTSYQEARAKLTTPLSTGEAATATSQPPLVRRRPTPLSDARAILTGKNPFKKQPRQSRLPGPPADIATPSSPRVAPTTPTAEPPTPVRNAASRLSIAVQNATRRPTVVTSLVGGALGAVLGGARGGLAGAISGGLAGAFTGAVAPSIIQRLSTPPQQSQPTAPEQAVSEPAAVAPQGPTNPPPGIPRNPFFKKWWFILIIIAIFLILLPILLSIIKSSSLCPPWEDGCGKIDSSGAPQPVGDYSVDIIKSGQEKVNNRQQITYELTITLKGPGLADIEVVDTIADNATFVNGDESPVVQGKKVAWQLQKIGPAKPKKLTFTVEPRTGTTWNDDVWVVNQAEAKILHVYGYAGSPVGGSCPDTAGNRSAESCKYLNPAIDIFDTSISQAGIEAYVKAYAPRFTQGGKGDEAEFRRRVDYIIKKSKEASLNPALALGLWKSESAFGTVSSREFGCAGTGFYEEVHCALGIEEFSNPVKNPIANCARSRDANSSACKALRELRAKEYEKLKPINYPVATFDDFMEAHGPYGHFTGGEPTNCMHSYNTILEVAKEIGACKPSASGTGPQPFPQDPTKLGVVVSCPLGNGNVYLNCGTAANPANGCGHGHPQLYRACTAPPYASCPNGGHSEALKKAIDISIGPSGPVFMPYLNGNQKVAWKLIQGPTAIDGGAWGYRVDYEAEFEGKKIHIDLTHLLSLTPPSSIFSGEQVGTYMAGDVAHLHTAVAIDGTWVEPKDIQMCVK